MPGGAGSIRDKLVHTIDGVVVWTARCQSMSEPELKAPGSYGDLSAAISYWQTASKDLVSLLDSITENGLAKELGYPEADRQSGTHTISEMLVHVLDHCTYHRAQVMAFLRAVGGEPESTTFRWFLRDRRH